MSSTDTPIELLILDRSYKLVCPSDEVEDLSASARHLDGKLREARKQMPRVEADRLAVLVALELCQDLMKANRSMQSQAACQRLIHSMIQEAQHAVAPLKSGPASR